MCSSGVGKDRDLRTAIRPILRGLNTLPDCTSQCAQQSHKCSHRQCSIPGTWCSAACGFIESITEMCRILREEGLGSSIYALQSYPFSFSRSWASLRYCDIPSRTPLSLYDEFPEVNGRSPCCVATPTRGWSCIPFSNAPLVFPPLRELRLKLPAGWLGGILPGGRCCAALHFSAAVQ